MARSKTGRLRQPNQTGSAWILAPAAVLILLVLASVTVDSAVVFLGQRQLSDAAASAALDAAHAINQSDFYTSGTIELDPLLATSLADQAIDQDSLSAVTLSGRPEVVVEGATACVTLTGVVHRIFAPALPGVPRQVVVHATAESTAEEGAATTDGGPC